MDYAAIPGLGTYAIRNMVKKRVTKNSIDTFAVSGPTAYPKGSFGMLPHPIPTQPVACSIIKDITRAPVMPEISRAHQSVFVSVL